MSDTEVSLILWCVFGVVCLSAVFIDNGEQVHTRSDYLIIRSIVILSTTVDVLRDNIIIYPVIHTERTYYCTSRRISPWGTLKDGEDLSYNPENINQLHMISFLIKLTG